MESRRPLLERKTTRGILDAFRAVHRNLGFGYRELISLAKVIPRPTSLALLRAGCARDLHFASSRSRFPVRVPRLLPVSYVDCCA